VDAVLKDFVSASFQHCGANITIAPNAVNKVGDTHTFTVTVSKTVSGTTTGVSGVKPTVTLTASNGATLTSVDKSDCETTGTDSSGQCEVTFTSTTAGIVTGHAEADVVITGTTFHVATGASSTTGGPDAVKRFVDAKISLSPLTDTNGITEDHVVTVTVQQDDGLAAADGGDGVSGWANAPDGTSVSFSLANNTASAVFKNGISSCNTTGGSCTITITTTTAGSVDIHATTTFTISGVSITRATGTGGNNSADANKVFIDGTLIWEKRATSTTGALLGGAQFSVCRTHTWDSSTSSMVDTPDVCLGSGSPPKIADDETAPGGTGANADNDPASGKFKLTQLVLGRYVITETDAPAGYAKDPTPQTVDLTLSNPSNADNTAGDVVPIFVNQQLFRIIVLTCNDSLNPKELVASSVTIDGTTSDSISAVPAGLAAKGVTQADLCGIGGAAKGGLAKNQDPGYSANVKVPKP
jgi:hypothetical protein